MNIKLMNLKFAIKSVSTWIGTEEKTQFINYFTILNDEKCLLNVGLFVPMLLKIYTYFVICEMHLKFIELFCLFTFLTDSSYNIYKCFQ